MSQEQRTRKNSQIQQKAREAFDWSAAATAAAVP
jgi:hypothetical protein